MRILVYIETHRGTATSTSRELVACARKIALTGATEVEALVAAAAPPSVASQVGSVDSVIAVTHPSLSDYNAEAQIYCLVEAIQTRKPDLVLIPYTSVGLDLAANAAAQCGVPLVSYCAKVTRADNTVTVEGQLYGGKLLAELDVPMPAILMVNPGSYREEDAGIFGGAILEASPPSALDALRTKVVKVNALDPNAVDITLAESLVCVGRGIGSKDNIDEVRSLVEKLGGELAGSRPVIDAGWLTKERQVGKSGRKVKPRLYLSLGVSGAPEHLEGMSASELIIAINTDAKAPIFDNAHFGATVDAMDFVESMIEQLK